MVSTKKPLHPLGENTKHKTQKTKDKRQPHPFYTQPNLTTFMKILNYKLSSTNELLTSRIGLITLAHTIQVLDLSKTIDQQPPLKIFL